jgi:hypothetical protein
MFVHLSFSILFFVRIFRNPDDRYYHLIDFRQLAFKKSSYLAKNSNSNNLSFERDLSQNRYSSVSISDDPLKKFQKYSPVIFSREFFLQEEIKRFLLFSCELSSSHFFIEICSQVTFKVSLIERLAESSLEIDKH